MIVKNESKVIVSTLENLCSYIPFDYWVISDTGSTDNTKELIVDFFDKKKVKGELFEEAWKDFGYNRTKALQRAYQKTDYLFIFDADDKIMGDFHLPDFTKDKYMFIFGQQVKYSRPLMVTNRKKWKFVGVLHEYLDIDETPNYTTEMIPGNYYILSGRTGNRSSNANKYYDDAVILTRAYVDETIRGDLKLAARYAFYCAQSFRDTSKHAVDSIEWYKKVLELDTWQQEKYFSCLQLGIQLFTLEKNEEALFYLLKAGFRKQRTKF
jgi:glycosyltransferase involved in cell wall biosynthesis